MKTLRTVLASAFLLLSVSSFAQTLISDSQISVTITGATTREELAQTTNQLHALGIKFSYNPVFDGQRHLTGISFEVTGTNGSAAAKAANDKLATPGQMVQFKMNKVNDKWGVACAGKCD